MSLAPWRVLLVSLSVTGCDVRERSIGDDTFEFPPGEVVGVCIANDAGVDGGVYHLTQDRYRECFSSPFTAFAADCPFAQCLDFFEQVCQQARDEGKTTPFVCDI